MYIMFLVCFFSLRKHLEVYQFVFCYLIELFTYQIGCWKKNAPFHIEIELGWEIDRWLNFHSAFCNEHSKYKNIAALPELEQVWLQSAAH